MGTVQPTINYLQELEQEARLVAKRLEELGEHPDLISMSDILVWDVKKERFTQILRKGKYEMFDWYKFKQEKGL